MRIEDTDQTRFVSGAEDYIVKSFEWCGIRFDEGVHVGGPFAPYRQSERSDIYQKYASEMVGNGFAYYAFDTPAELEAKRKEAETSKSPPFQYDCKTRQYLRNSISLSSKETERLLAENTPYVIRIKIPENETIVLNDLIRGRIEVDSNLLDDKVLFKSDGLPTYHLANVVDDYLMKITHVIRGEEWLPSAPLHVILYRFLGWEASMPEFAHLPLLLKPDGKGKLSKRDGDRLGFPVFPLQWTDPASGEISSGYRESGYLPEAFVNMLALLGWNPGTNQEIFSISELIEVFSLSRVSKSGARFDAEKAKWFNHQYIQKKQDAEIADLLLPYLNQKGIEPEPGKLRRIVALVKERANLITDFPDQISFFFLRPQSYDEQLIKKRWKPETSSILGQISDFLNQQSITESSEFSLLIKGFIEQHQMNLGSVMFALRISMVGSAMGPDLFQIMGLLGREEVIQRIHLAISKIQTL